MNENIIYELDRKGINLQETILNLKHQGYGYIYDAFLREVMQHSLDQVLWEYVAADLRELTKRVGKAG